MSSATAKTITNKELAEMLKECITTLNHIPNKSGVGSNGESSYEVASKASKLYAQYEKQEK